MEIYLMQHGAAYEKNLNPERPLTPEGERAILAASLGIKRLGVSCDTLIASTKKRSQQTADLVARTLELSPDIIRIAECADPQAPPQHAVEFIMSLHHHSSVLMTGHMPSLHKLAAFLLAEDDWPMLHFEHGGLCRIRTDEPPSRTGLLYFLLTQKQLAMIGRTEDNV
jgi:phosphohistidine phosphatase SixA